MFNFWRIRHIEILVGHLVRLLISSSIFFIVVFWRIRKKMIFFFIDDKILSFIFIFRSQKQWRQWWGHSFRFSFSFFKSFNRNVFLTKFWQHVLPPYIHLFFFGFFVGWVGRSENYYDVPPSRFKAWGEKEILFLRQSFLIIPSK